MKTRLGSMDFTRIEAGEYEVFVDGQPWGTIRRTFGVFTGVPLWHVYKAGEQIGTGDTYRVAKLIAAKAVSK